MSQQELLKIVVSALDGAGIAYMVTGSVASSLQGEPRATHDIDLVVALDRSDTSVLLRAFPAPDFYLDEISVLEAIETQKMFNLIDCASGDKVDFWLLTGEPFDRSRFVRRYAEDLTGMRLMVSRPEDTILAKLRWAKMSGGSEKQFVDALRVYEVQRDSLDLQYLAHWAAQLGVEELLERLKGQAGPP